MSYIGQDCREIPEQLSMHYGHFAKRLDLSFNLLRYVTLERCRPGLGHSGPSRTFGWWMEVTGLCRVSRNMEPHAKVWCCFR